MEQYKVATTKPEKDAIMNEIRKCTRAYDAMKNVSISSPVLKPARPAPWPKTSEDSYILIISDTEDEDEDDEYDDMTL
ncbi:hypothetical protein QCA50_011448 [Cerrena zonata]|uniref:Uncharacterized protein n=1 Tax=Cerrena zonata TaxID=2478898 RepID=A0AAW0FXE3_9APHY